MITTEIEKALQRAMLDKLEALGVDTKDPGFAMVVILVEPKGGNRATMHLGSYHCDDDEVLELLAEAPKSVAYTREREAIEAAGKQPS